MEIKIKEIAKIKLEPSEKLLVKVPDGSNAENIEEVRKSILKFFNIMPDRLLVYAGDVEFKKVQG